MRDSEREREGERERERVCVREDIFEFQQLKMRKELISDGSKGRKKDRVEKRPRQKKKKAIQTSTERMRSRVIHDLFIERQGSCLKVSPREN